MHVPKVDGSSELYEVDAARQTTLAALQAWYIGVGVARAPGAISSGIEAAARETVMLALDGTIGTAQTVSNAVTSVLTTGTLSRDVLSYQSDSLQWLISGKAADITAADIKTGFASWSPVYQFVNLLENASSTDPERNIQAGTEAGVMAAAALGGKAIEWTSALRIGGARVEGAVATEAQQLDSAASLRAPNSSEFQATGNSARDIGELLGAENNSNASNNPLFADKIDRDGDRLVVNQGSTPTCGANSCLMVLDTLGRSVDVLTLIARIPPRIDGIFTVEVRDLLRSEGVNAAAYSGRDVADLARYTESGTPVVVRIQDASSDFSHFVVVDGVTNRQGVSVVAIRDPHGLQYFSPVDTFSKYFTGEIVVPRK